MAGYSATPLVKKLGIQAGSQVLLVSEPDGFLTTLGPLPDGAEIVDPTTKSKVDVAVLFVTSKANLAKSFAKVAARLPPAGGLWVAWPKKTSRVATDLTENVVREIGLEEGLVDNKVCAIDETWSGLRFVIRLTDRPKKALPRRSG